VAEYPGIILFTRRNEQLNLKFKFLYSALANGSGVVNRLIESEPPEDDSLF
jgi:hypothetical protein